MRPALPHGYFRGMLLSLSQRRDALVALGWFAAGTLLTAFFVQQNADLYASPGKLWLSGCIAGGKWAVQVAAALLLPGGPRLAFLRAIGRVCAIGSVLLLAYLPLQWLGQPAAAAFAGALGVSVAYMIVAYFRAVRVHESLAWFWGWLACLCLAVNLQLTVVFGIW